MDAQDATQPISIPERGDPDRKRTLNVLAQRRYRQRRRERMALLEQRTGAVRPSFSSQTAPSVSIDRTQVSNQPGPGIKCSTDTSTGASSSLSPVSTSLTADSSGEPQHNFFDGTLASINSTECSIFVGATTNRNSQTHTSESAERFPLDFDPSFFPYGFDLNSELEDLETSQFTFPDDTTLDIPVLSVLKAGTNIATLLGCQDTIWDLMSRRTLPPSSLSGVPLTSNFEPTPAQQTILHHPFLDILPWPSVRSKLVMIFSLPVQARPMIARDPMALMQLVMDVDDDAEGMRITGFDWRDESNWEIGQKVFENWWFVLDRDIIGRSNVLREKRGATKLLPPVPSNEGQGK